MNQNNDNTPQNDLKNRIKAMQAKHDNDPTNDPGYEDKQKDGKAMGQAVRAGVELVSAVGVGTFMGYWIDVWLDTAPFAMIIFFFLGFAAGFMNIYKAQMGIYHKTGIGQLTNESKNGQKNADKSD